MRKGKSERGDDLRPEAETKGPTPVEGGPLGHYCLGGGGGTAGGLERELFFKPSDGGRA
jgi:hypothetical protein